MKHVVEIKHRPTGNVVINEEFETIDEAYACIDESIDEVTELGKYDYYDYYLDGQYVC